MSLARLTLVTGLSVVVLLGAGGDAGSAAQIPGGLIPLRRGCEVSTFPLTFGNYDPITGRAVDALGQVRYICDRVERPDRAVRDVRITISRGATNSFSDRAMVGPSFENLFYNVYLDASHTTVWGDGTNGTDLYVDRHPPNGTPVIVPIYGRIAPLQDVPAGTYGDLLQVTIQF